MEEKLWLACKDGDIEEVNTLLQNPQINTNWQFLDCSASPFDHTFGWTPFYIACCKGHIEIVKLLLNDKRVHLNIANKYGSTPFYIACCKGHIEIVKLLLNDNRIDINKANKNGETSFYIACLHGKTEIVKLLLNDKRIDIKRGDIKEQTPFFISCQKGCIEIVKHLLAHGREIDINKKDDEGKDALDIAREIGNKKKDPWESEKHFESRKRNCPKIVELIESFKGNQSETRTKLRIELGFAGKFLFLSFSFFSS